MFMGIKQIELIYVYQNTRRNLSKKYKIKENTLCKSCMLEAASKYTYIGQETNPKGLNHIQNIIRLHISLNFVRELARLHKTCVYEEIINNYTQIVANAFFLHTKAQLCNLFPYKTGKENRKFFVFFVESVSKLKEYEKVSTNTQMTAKHRH